MLDYEVPGIAEAMRAASMAIVKTAMLSRAVAGVRDRTLIVNLPGSPKAVRETLAVILPALAARARSAARRRDGRLGRDGRSPARSLTTAVEVGSQ